MPVDPQALAQSMPFAVALGVEVTAAVPEEVRGRLGWTPERCTTGGVLHGAALMALGDTLGAVCAFLNLPPGASTGCPRRSSASRPRRRPEHRSTGQRRPRRRITRVARSIGPRRFRHRNDGGSGSG